MSATTAAATGAATARTRVLTDPADQAFVLLRTAFVVAPIASASTSSPTC